MKKIITAALLLALLLCACGRPAAPNQAESSAAPLSQATVRLTIDGSAAAPYGWQVSLPAQTMPLHDGESVLDLLKRCGLSVHSGGSGRMAYVRGIGGLNERDCGGSSGWVYQVNGAQPPVSCGMYQPKNGDEIVWRYSLTS